MPKYSGRDISQLFEIFKKDNDESWVKLSGNAAKLCLSIAMSLAILYCGLTIEEAFKAITYYAAKAINMDDKIGLIKSGFQADLLFWNIESIDEIPYWMGSDHMISIMKKGKFLEE